MSTRTALTLSHFSQIVSLPERTLRGWIAKGKLSRPDPVSRKGDLQTWLTELRLHYVGYYPSEREAVAQCDSVGRIDLSLQELKPKNNFVDTETFYRSISEIWRP